VDPPSFKQFNKIITYHIHHTYSFFVVKSRWLFCFFRQEIQIWQHANTHDKSKNQNLDHEKPLRNIQHETDNGKKTEKTKEVQADRSSASRKRDGGAPLQRVKPIIRLGIALTARFVHQTVHVRALTAVLDDVFLGFHPLRPYLAAAQRGRWRKVIVERKVPRSLLHGY
jgi:hypothetical protein